MKAKQLKEEKEKNDKKEKVEEKPTLEPWKVNIFK